MRFTTGKFKYLQEATKILPPGRVPAFETPRAPNELTLKFPLILRSALRDEAQREQLLSGKSLSVAHVDSLQKLEAAWREIHAQADFAELIAQTEVPWGTHFTLVFEKNFFFAEARVRTGSAEFLYWTPLTQTRHEQPIRELRKLLSELAPLLAREDLWLLEVGEADGKYFLFQVQPITLAHLGHIFTSELALRVVSTRQRFQGKTNLWQLLKTEWAARKFRREARHALGPSAVFLNWEYIFHYFRLYCMVKGQVPDAHAFANFLSLGFEKNWISQLFQQHLEIANYLRKNEPFDPVSATFPHQGMIFIGKGKRTGVVGDDVLVSASLELEQIYRAKGVRVILTKEVSLLGHPILAAVENHIALVVGIPDERFRELRPGDKISLDFEQRLLGVN